MAAPQDVLLLSCADRVHNARAIVSDLRTHGPAMTRFNGGRDGTLLYYAALAAVFNQRLPGPLSRDLTLLVGGMSELAGRCLPPLSTFPVEVLPALSFRPSPFETFKDAVCEPDWFRLFMVSDVPVIGFFQDPKGTVNDIAQSDGESYIL